MTQKDVFRFGLMVMFMLGMVAGGVMSCTALLPHVDTTHMKDGKTWKACK